MKFTTLLIILGTFFLASCIQAYESESPSTQQITTVNDVVEVSILKYQFIPQVIVIKPGQTVRWTNQEKRQYHSVWFEKSGEPEPDYFFPDETYEKVFKESGEFDYRCGPHPEMIGKVIVKQ
ncbi:plastocyanin/azurin family copper-binding protein [Aliikangiella sp. G2MR2-5]|uniref:cupredoxin domain-containing protein n=1 Tax=Aliikangiella sp. G2MR2-5 TaxID=2788943 RepID=UPI0018A9A27E|nr:plastocyanin/azurin family copper-binding protein [Aliikangiella sp. G2MR2-5]